MNLYIKLKHWQIFLLWIFASIQLGIFMKTNVWVISFYLYLILLFGWVYSIGYFFNKNHNKKLRKLNIWTLIYLISMFPVGMRFHAMKNFEMDNFNPILFFIFGTFGFISMINIFKIASQSLKENELNKKLSFKEYLVEFFLMVYLMIGIWILQPRLNKLLSNKSTTGNTV